jgi:hypothetical protein
MIPLNQNLNNFARAFSDFVKSIVHILIWATICFAGLTTAYVGFKIILFVAKSVLKSLGIEY